MSAFYDFLEKNSYYVVLIITLLIWIGIFLYLRKLDKKIKTLELNNN
jgi:CcmD family protein